MGLLSSMVFCWECSMSLGGIGLSRNSAGWKNICLYEGLSGNRAKQVAKISKDHKIGVYRSSITHIQTRQCILKPSYCCWLSFGGSWNLENPWMRQSPPHHHHHHHHRHPHHHGIKYKDLPVRLLRRQRLRLLGLLQINILRLLYHFHD